MRRLYESRDDVRAWLRHLFETDLVGAEQARTLRQIQDRPDCPRSNAFLGNRPVDGRELRSAISDLVRRDGLPIIGDSRRGYYLAATPDELRAAYAELRHRALRILWRGSRLLRQGQHRLGGQRDLLRLECREADSALAALGAEEGEIDE